VAAERPPTIWVIAGPNGGGKSSIVGELIRACGADYFNADEYTRHLGDQNPGLPIDQANSLAWAEGKRRLEAAIATRQSFAFETTLGGRTITRLLHQAADHGSVLHIWYIALDSADHHVARVAARAAAGGHPIAEERIRARYNGSRANLARLIPKVAALKVYDNSDDADVNGAERPRPRLVLEFVSGQIRNRDALATTPEWAKPIVVAALKAERPIRAAKH
jgi:predicted ABC-type ATPase